MHMMVCSEWAGATLSSRVAPQKFCIIMLLSQHVFLPGREHFCFSLSGIGQVRYNQSVYINSLTGDWRKGEQKWKTIASI